MQIYTVIISSFISLRIIRWFHNIHWGIVTTRYVYLLPSLVFSLSLYTIYRKSVVVQWRKQHRAINQQVSVSIQRLHLYPAYSKWPFRVVGTEMYLWCVNFESKEAFILSEHPILREFLRFVESGPENGNWLNVTTLKL